MKIRQGLPFWLYNFVNNCFTLSRFKAPLLQSLLSNRRITNILNKYADDAILSSSTLSLMAQNQMSSSSGVSSSEIKVTNGDCTDLKPTEVDKLDKEDLSEADKVTFDLNLAEVHVVVDSSSSVSPSSPSSSASSHPASPPSQTPPNSQPAHTQISAQGTHTHNHFKMFSILFIKFIVFLFFRSINLQISAISLLFRQFQRGLERFQCSFLFCSITFVGFNCCDGLNRK